MKKEITDFKQGTINKTCIKFPYSIKLNRYMPTS